MQVSSAPQQPDPKESEIMASIPVVKPDPDLMAGFDPQETSQVHLLSTSQDKHRLDLHFFQQ